MKQCPQCKSLYGDENLFCLNDGTTLVLSAPPDSVNSATGDIPTQILSQIPSQNLSVAPRHNEKSGWLYAIIGGLATAVVALVVFAFVLRPGDEAKKTVEAAEVKDKQTEKERSADEPKTVQSNTKAQNQILPSSSPPAVSPFPNGKFAGSWSSPTGGAFDAELSLNETAPGRLQGQIIWTLRGTTKPEKMGKIGLSATEYVQGTFNPATRQILLNGYRKDDPNDIVILDGYRLQLSANGNNVAGATRGTTGKWRGRLNLNRF